MPAFDGVSYVQFYTSAQQRAHGNYDKPHSSVLENTTGDYKRPDIQPSSSISAYCILMHYEWIHFMRYELLLHKSLSVFDYNELI